MLHERTVPLVDHDAVAVRDESDTLVLYAERLSTAQRAGLRLYLLEVLEQQEGPAVSVAVAAGATERVLAGRGASTPAVAPLGLVGTVLVTLAVALVAAAFVVTVVGLIVEVQLPDEGNGPRPPGPVLARDNRPAAGTPLMSVATPAEQPPMTRQDEPPPGDRPGVTELPVDVLGTVQQVVPTSEPLAANLTAGVSSAPSPVGVVDPGQVTPAAPAPAEGGGLIDLPEVRLPRVDLPDVDLPVDLPDIDLPPVGLPDVDLQGASPDASEEGGDEPEGEDDESEAGEDSKGGDEPEADDESEGSSESEGEDTSDAEAAEPDPGESDE